MDKYFIERWDLTSVKQRVKSIYRTLQAVKGNDVATNFVETDSDNTLALLSMLSDKDRAFATLLCPLAKGAEDYDEEVSSLFWVLSCSSSTLSLMCYRH